MSETQEVSVKMPRSAASGSEKEMIERQQLMQYQIARILAESNSIAKAAAQVLKLICETASWEFGALWRVEAELHLLRNEGVWQTGEDDLAEYANTIQYSVVSDQKTSLPGCVLDGTQPLWLTSLENIMAEDAQEAGRAGMNGAFLLPIRSSGRLIAILEFLTRRVQFKDRGLSELLTAVGDQIGIFLERKLLEETLATQAKQQRLLAQAGLAVTNPIEYEGRLMTMMHVIVPEMADWCAIDRIDPDHTLRRVAAAHIDPDKEPLVYAIQPTRTLEFLGEGRPQLDALLAGQSLLYTDLSMPEIEASVSDPEIRRMVRELEPCSCIVVPLLAHDRILGICTFVHSDSRRRYLPGDLALAEDIGRQIALGLDNANLFAEARQANLDLERRVDERTNQLRNAISQLTNQIVERKLAEDQVRILNSELEQRIVERTSQLEIANRELQKEIVDRQQTSQTLRILLKRTRELYQISQKIGTVRSPNEVLGLLISSSYFKDASRASIAILDQPWRAGGTPPRHCFILAEWNRGASRPRFINRRFTLQEYGIVPPVRYGKPIMIPDIQLLKKLPAPIRKRFADLQTKSLIILPLIAGGEWYGLLSLHFSTLHLPGMEDLRHLRGLVDETAIAINNLRLLEAESKARHEAEVANDVKLKFLAMISHELRTPLASIKGFATTLLAEDVVWSEEKKRDFLETINSESDKLSDLIEQLLDLSRIEAGTLRILPKLVSPGQVIAKAVERLRAIITDQELIFNETDGLPAVQADEQRIDQVINNLVGNASKYSPLNTRITVSVCLVDGFIQVDVADQGPGIPPAERGRIFEAFHQLENGLGARRMRGAGLGLAICKGLIEAHGGKIWIQNLPLPGTTVSFSLPVVEGPGLSE